MAETGRVNILYPSLPHKTWKKQSSSWSVQLNLQTPHWSPFLEFSFIIHHPPSFLGVKTPFQHAQNTNLASVWRFQNFFDQAGHFQVRGHFYGKSFANSPDGKLWKKKPVKTACLWWRNFRSNPVTNGDVIKALSPNVRLRMGRKKNCIFSPWLPVEFQWIPAETPPPSYLVLKGDASKGLIAIPTLCLEGNRAYQLRIDYHMVRTGAAILLSPFLWVPLL